MRRPARPPFPTATIALAVTIIGVFAVEVAGDGMGLCQQFGFVAARPGLVAALVSLFLHDPRSWLHVGGNLLVLATVGARVERAIGSWRFATVFLLGGLAGAALHVVVDPSAITPLVGASGAIFALLAVAATFLGTGVFAFAVVLAATNVAHAFGGPGDAAVSFGAHIGGFALGTAVAALGRGARRPAFAPT